MQSKILFLSIFLAGMLANVQAQENTYQTKNGEVREYVPVPPEKRMQEFAVYPGCENLVGHKVMLIRCFALKFGNDAKRALDTSYPITADPSKDFLIARIQFKVKKDGTIGDIKAIGGDSIIFNQVERSIEKLSKKMQKEGKLIRPAKNVLGEDMECKLTQDFSISRPKNKKVKKI
ncbi:hypothetical protein [Ornithobacterium rhinotracheale]|uniref:hypothetical protein n=1 Tax=Ornithobacterium rhinotracheale TaxID=28251 RepID=UPI0040366BE0